MIFLCFSSKDRTRIAESIFYHIHNIGLSIWYDRNEILMGDDRNYKNFVEGVDSCEYAIIVLSQNAINSVCANEEIDLIHNKFLKKETYIFPVFYNITARDIPNKYDWMTELVYKELNDSTDSRGLCNHVVCKVLNDILQNLKYNDINSIVSFLGEPLKELIESYISTDTGNYNARAALLYSGMLFMKKQNPGIPDYCEKGITFLFNETKLSLPLDWREILIFERLFIIMANYYLSWLIIVNIISVSFLGLVSNPNASIFLDR